MTDKAKEAIKELEEIRLELFRCAADLDNHIRDLSYYINDTASSEVNCMCIRTLELNRDDMTRVKTWDKLQEREKEAWSKLLDNLS